MQINFFYRIIGTFQRQTKGVEVALQNLLIRWVGRGGFRDQQGVVVAAFEQYHRIAQVVGQAILEAGGLSRRPVKDLFAAFLLVWASATGPVDCAVWHFIGFQLSLQQGRDFWGWGQEGVH